MACLAKLRQTWKSRPGVGPGLSWTAQALGSSGHISSQRAEAQHADNNTTEGPFTGPVRAVPGQLRPNQSPALPRAGCVSAWNKTSWGTRACTHLLAQESDFKLQPEQSHCQVRTKELEHILAQSQNPEATALSHQLAAFPGACTAAAQARRGLQTVAVPTPPLGLPA